MATLKDIVNKAIADYGFRQVVLWTPDDIIQAWGLPPREAQALLGQIRESLEILPNPVEPQNIHREQKHFAQLISSLLD